MVDMKHFDQFSMDESTYTATIGPGITLGDLDTALYNAGHRAMAHGICPTIRTGGHLTIGGLGPTARQWGLALDHVEEVEVVLANSSIVRASDTQNQEILFAVKGAAASFGIVTEFKVRTEEAPGLAVQYSFTFNLGTAAEKAKLVKDWQAFIAQEDLTWKFYSNMNIIDGQIILEGIYFGSKAEYDALAGGKVPDQRARHRASPNRLVGNGRSWTGRCHSKTGWKRPDLVLCQVPRICTSRTDPGFRN